MVCIEGKTPLANRRSVYRNNGCPEHQNDPVVTNWLWLQETPDRQLGCIFWFCPRRRGSAVWSTHWENSCMWPISLPTWPTARC